MAGQEALAGAGARSAELTLTCSRLLGMIEGWQWLCPHALGRLGQALWRGRVGRGAGRKWQGH